MAKDSSGKTMKVLYIGHYKENSGWGNVIRNNILALDSVGVDVVPRPINLNNSNVELPTRLIELEQKSVKDCDICIQHVLPHYMSYNSAFRKNIGIFELETNNIQLTSWTSHLNLLDEVWVPCKQMLDININKPTHVVPHAVDINRYTKQYDRLTLPINDKFTFYFIGEFNRRKNIGAILKAFHTEFLPHEPVELVLKVNKPGCDSRALAEEFKNYCNKLKDGLRLYKEASRYKSEIIITVNVSDEDILRLHSSCNCFITSSRGEAWCLPAIDAMGVGNLVISSATGAMLDYIDSTRNGFLVGGTIEPVFCQFDTIPEFGTAREQWFEISINQLMKTMRRVYEMRPERKQQIQTEAKLSVSKYSYEKVGQQMKELLSV